METLNETSGKVSELSLVMSVWLIFDKNCPQLCYYYFWLSTMNIDWWELCGVCVVICNISGISDFLTLHTHCSTDHLTHDLPIWPKHFLISLKMQQLYAHRELFLSMTEHNSARQVFAWTYLIIIVNLNVNVPEKYEYHTELFPVIIYCRVEPFYKMKIVRIALSRQSQLTATFHKRLLYWY